MAISSPGIGSKLDVNTIVTQLMGIESRPLAQLNTREISFQAKLSAFGSIRSALSQFQGTMSSLSFASRFEGATATSSDATAISASATARAPAGSYTVEVSALAQNQRLVAAGQATTTATIGTGTLTFDFGTISGGSFDAQTGRLGGDVRRNIDGDKGGRRRQVAHNVRHHHGVGTRIHRLHVV